MFRPDAGSGSFPRVSSRVYSGESVILGHRTKKFASTAPSAPASSGTSSWICAACGIVNASERRVCHQCQAQKVAATEKNPTQFQFEKEQQQQQQPFIAANFAIEEDVNWEDATGREFELARESDPTVDAIPQFQGMISLLPPRPTLEVPDLRSEAVDLNQVADLGSEANVTPVSHPLHHPDVLQLPHTHLSTWRWRHIVRVLTPATPITDFRKAMVELHSGLEIEPPDAATAAQEDVSSPNFDTRILGVDPCAERAIIRQATNPNNVRQPSLDKHPYKSDSSANKSTKIPPWVNSFAAWLANVSEAQRSHFYAAIVPFLCKLVAQLPILFSASDPIRVLPKGKSGTRHLSAEQCACLLATGFFGLHIDRQPGYQWTSLNHAKLFLFLGDVGHLGHAQENKLRCLLNYFALIRRELYPQGITNSQALPAFTPTERVITFHRRCLSSGQADRFSIQKLGLCGSPLAPISVSHAVAIEDGPPPHAHVVGATHRILGSGALNRSASSEEIRLLAAPEALCLIALAEALEAHESFIVTGARRCSDYLGFGKSFSFHGSHAQEPADSVMLSVGERRRIRNTVIFLDPLQYDMSELARAGASKHSVEQYSPHLMLRETLKAFAGFSLPVSPPTTALGVEEAKSSTTATPASTTIDAATSSNPINSPAKDTGRLGGILESSIVPEVVASASDLFEIHTGAWGCGHHGGDLQLKVLLQWIAASCTMSGAEPKPVQALEAHSKQGNRPSVSRTTLKGKLSPEEFMSLPPARSLVIHPYADPRAAGLEHFLDFVRKHPLGGVTEWSDDSETRHGLTVSQLWIALVSYAEEMQKRDGPVLSALRKEERQRRIEEGTHEPVDRSSAAEMPRRLPTAGRGPIQTSESMPPTTQQGQASDLFGATTSVFQYLERYFDLMWKQTEHKKSMACVVL